MHNHHEILLPWFVDWFCFQKQTPHCRIFMALTHYSHSTVETLYSTIYYSKYFIELNIDNLHNMLPFELTKDTPYLPLLGELWSVFYEYLNRNWSCYKGFLQYFCFSTSRFKINGNLCSIQGLYLGSCKNFNWMMPFNFDSNFRTLGGEVRVHVGVCVLTHGQGPYCVLAVEVTSWLCYKSFSCSRRTLVTGKEWQLNPSCHFFSLWQDVQVYRTITNYLS